MKDINRILCPVDFSEPSREAVGHAVDLAVHFSAHIVLFHAVSPIEHLPTPSYTVTPTLMDQMMLMTEQITGSANAALGELIADLVPTGVGTLQRVEVGDPAARIVEVAREEGVDLIVMSTHGRSGIRGLFFGSVAEKVVRGAGCPVLTMKPRGTPEA